MSDWVRTFFEGRVGFDLNRIEGEGKPYNPPLNQYFNRFLEFSRDSQGPCILPIHVKDKYIELIFATPTQEQSSELRNISDAYFGKAYGKVGGALITESIDPSYKKVLDQFPGGIVRVRVFRGKDDPPNYYRRIYQAMDLAIQLVEQYRDRPINLSNARRPTGRMLQDIYAALRDQKRTEVYRLYDELSSSNGLSARNLLFLEFKIYSSFHSWAEILDHPNLADILSSKVPNSVAKAFLSAVDALLIPHGSLADFDVEGFRSRIKDALTFFYGELDLDRLDTTVRMWRTWTVGATVVENFEGVNRISDLVGSEWLDALNKYLGLPLDQGSFSRKDSDRFVALLEAEETFESAIALLQFTFQADLHQLTTISNRLRDFPQAIVEEILNDDRINTHWKKIVGDTSSVRNLAGWSDWYSNLRDGTDPDQLLEAFVENIENWDKTSWDETLFIEFVDDDSGSSIGVIRNVLPMVLTWLEDNDIQLSPKSLDPLITNLAIDSAVNINDISIARDLMEILLTQTHETSEYVSMLDAVGLIWEKVKSKSALPNIFELFELLLDSPCLSCQARVNLWQNFQPYLLSDWQRLGSSDKIIAKKLSEEVLGTSEQFSFEFAPGQATEDTDAIMVDGKSLAIYTLVEKAAVRAKGILGELFPGIKITVNHDHTATSALVNLAKKADYFIFAAQAAKHQAFYPVTDLRSDIIYPEGKGTTSIVRAFIDKVENDT